MSNATLLALVVGGVYLLLIISAVVSEGLQILPWLVVITIVSIFTGAVFVVAMAQQIKDKTGKCSFCRE